jgi:catalase
MNKTVIQITGDLNGLTHAAADRYRPSAEHSFNSWQLIRASIVPRSRHSTSFTGNALMAIGLLSLTMARAASAAQPAPVVTPSAGNPAATASTNSTPTQLVDALNGVFGKQVHGRAIHAKGIVLEGSFTPSVAAASLSKAPHFHGAAVPVTVRFSNFAGIPKISDTDGLATPRGFAVKFHLANGADTDLVAHSFNGFPSATAEEFRQLMVAIGTSGPGTPSPTPAEAFMGTHPTAKYFFDHLTPPPESFATLPYYGVNSFRFTNAKNESKFGRYQIVPQAGAHFLSKDAFAGAGPNYLEEDIARRVAAGPVKFTLQVQLAAKGDQIENPAITWPDSRDTVTLGVITITSIAKNSEAEERQLMFTPSAITDGIATADPMIEARNGAYGVSYGRRHETP